MYAGRPVPAIAELISNPEISHAAGIANPESFRGNLQVAIPGQTLAARPSCRQTGANFTT